MTITDIARQYTVLGFTHVIPLGFDHILFIIGVFFLNSNLRAVVIQCSIFTLAHSISLGIVAAGYFSPISAIVEPIIALSILAVAVENIFRRDLSNWRLGLIFLFGLVHGMGFAAALKEIGLPENNFLGALFFFNVGVEFGQITVIVATYYLAAKWFSKREWYHSRVVYPISSIIGCIALYWTVQRLLQA